MSNLINLTKKVGIVLEKKKLSNIQAEIVLAIDCSGSMNRLYQNGTVQQLVERLLAIGMNMDANKEIDVFQFNGDSKHIGVATESNHSNFVKDKHMSANGGTNYAPVMKDIINDYGAALTDSTSSSTKKSFLGGLFGSKQDSKVIETKKVEHPTFVFFITDGNNFDTAEAERVVRESSSQPIFWQFVGIGQESFTFLRKLDDLSGRVVDNANFFKINDISAISDEELYDKLLTEFPDWLKEAKAKGMLA